MGLVRFLLGLMRNSSGVQLCAGCSRSLVVLPSQGPSGLGGVMLDRQQLNAGYGAAEQCWECSRVYCDECYPARPRNSCDCGRGRQRIRSVRGTVYRGSLRLVKVQYVR